MDEISDIEHSIAKMKGQNFTFLDKIKIVWVGNTDLNPILLFATDIQSVDIKLHLS